MKPFELLWMDFFKKRRGPQADAVKSALRNNILFHTLSGKELRLLSDSVHKRSYRKGEVVFRKGDRGFGLYIVMRGKVEIWNETEAHPDVLVNTLSQGSFFGELALIDDRNLRVATAIASEDCELLGFFKPDLNEILERRPGTGVKILLQITKVLGRRIMEMIDTLPSEVETTRKTAS